MQNIVVILGTGGTIAGTAAEGASDLAYQAAQLGVDALVQAVPELRDVPLEAEQVAQIDSKDMTHAIWQALTQRVLHHLLRAGLRIFHEHALEVAGHQAAAHLEHLRRHIRAVIGLEVIEQTVVFVIALRVLLGPGIQVLNLLLRIAGVFQGLVEEVVFTLIFYLFFGRLRVGELGSPRNGHGAHDGDGRDLLEGLN